jgi:hypothetical protein
MLDVITVTGVRVNSALKLSSVVSDDMLTGILQINTLNVRICYCNTTDIEVIRVKESTKNTKIYSETQPVGCKRQKSVCSASIIVTSVKLLGSVHCLTYI